MHRIVRTEPHRPRTRARIPGPSAAALLLLGLSLVAGPAAAERVTRLVYEESEPQIGSYRSRVLVGERYLRLDDDQDAGDLVLYDRRSGVVSSVVHERRTLFEVHPRESPPLHIPATVGLNEEINPGSADPDYPGRSRLSVRFIGADGVCGGAEVLARALPRATAAMLEYARAIRANNLADLDKTPADLRTPCFYIDNFIAGVRALELGLPVAQWRANGHRRLLIERAVVDVDDALFELPAYTPFSFTAPPPTR